MAGITACGGKEGGGDALAAVSGGRSLDSVHLEWPIVVAGHFKVYSIYKFPICQKMSFQNP